MVSETATAVVPERVQTMRKFLSRVNLKDLRGELQALAVILLLFAASCQYNVISARADSLLGPGIGADSFVPGSLKCSSVQNAPEDWSMIISGEFVDRHATAFGLYYYAISDPESNPDTSTPLGPIVDSVNYHVVVDGVERAHGPIVQMPAPGGKSHKLVFRIDHVSGDQYFQLKALYLGVPLSLDRSPVSIVGVTAPHPPTC